MAAESWAWARPSAGPGGPPPAAARTTTPRRKPLPWGAGISRLAAIAPLPAVVVDWSQCLGAAQTGGSESRGAGWRCQPVGGDMATDDPVSAAPGPVPGRPTPPGEEAGTARRRLGAWGRLRLFGRRWPAAFRRAHHLSVYVLLPLLLATGAALYFPRLHSGLVRWLPILLALHVWSGIALIALLLLPVVRPLGQRLVARLDWVATCWFLAGLGVTGLVLWKGVGGGLVRAGAFTLHGLLALGLVAWVLGHGLLRVRAALRGRGGGPAAPGRVRLPRRELLATLGRAVLFSVGGTFVVGWLGGLLLARGQRAIALGAQAATPAGGAGTGGGPLPGFQLYTVTGGYPSYDPATWRLAVEGLVHTPLSLSLSDLRRLPQVAETDAFHCVTGWVVPGVRWQGVRIADLLARAGVRPEAAWITFDSFDGVYTDSLSLSQATAPGVLLALRADGRPLARQQGAPLRLLVPQMYGYKSVKWLQRLRLVTSQEMGYWEQRGYGPNAYLGRVNGWPAGKNPWGPLLF